MHTGIPSVSWFRVSFVLVLERYISEASGVECWTLLMWYEFGTWRTPGVLKGGVNTRNMSLTVDKPRKSWSHHVVAYRPLRR